jgi:eukaryotic-like serine/threonine-protein kinase
LLEEIGHGGMGVVYRARQKSLDRIVALKVLLFGPHASAESVKRFRAEAVATAALQHPNIVAIHEVGFCQGQHYIAMDYVEGQPLSALIRGSPLAARRAASYVKAIVEAIHYAHERGILHRDLKPANVLIDANDQPRITDFGLAKRLESDSDLTLSGQLLGSPSYIPPEQATGKRLTLSRRSDVYALGAILYHALTGRPPFVGEGMADTVQQVLTTEPVSPRLLNRAVPHDLETVCLKCLEKEPAKRYATAQMLAEELGQFLDGKQVHATRRPSGQGLALVPAQTRIGDGIGSRGVRFRFGFQRCSLGMAPCESQRVARPAERLRRRHEPGAGGTREVGLLQAH